MTKFTRRRLFAVTLFAALSLTAPHAARSLSAAGELPNRLTDREFWALTEELSEPSGFFRSDNFLSNERGYQLVIPALTSSIQPGGVYMGVGPEQNFPYIVALKSRMAFIVDIRRGNLHEQLLYKALFETSRTRPEFLARLFSRKQPSTLNAKSTLAEIFAAYHEVPPSDDLFRDNVKAVLDWLTVKHRFPLSDDDLKGIAYVYHDAFFRGGPNLNYGMSGGGLGGNNAPTYEQLMLAHDARGQNRGFLATEENFAFLKDLERRNLVVPVVGNFGGPKAIRAVGTYVREHGGTVAAFYLSNVEQVPAAGQSLGQLLRERGDAAAG